MQFAQVLLALELFLLSPFVRRYVRVASLTAHVVGTAVMALVGGGGGIRMRGTGNTDYMRIASLTHVVIMAMVRV